MTRLQYTEGGRAAPVRAGAMFKLRFAIREGL